MLVDNKASCEKIVEPVVVDNTLPGEYCKENSECLSNSCIDNTC